MEFESTIYDSELDEDLPVTVTITHAYAGARQTFDHPEEPAEVEIEVRLDGSKQDIFAELADWQQAALIEEAFEQLTACHEPPEDYE